ncbi:MAG: glycerol-3-phosphate dehydrogenase/oxidase, partial [Planctomycetes bacterium]|nr:glycerol-3-phosphate dehydrogenase/oxidase [Planctomycetota bacterium]
MNQREQTFDDLRRRPDVPVLILGGGINGVGLLRELALQGVDALLVDKADFVAGASSKSSRMIHGGLRYLENREFRLVRESLFERNRLLANAAHYVAPLKTTIPLFSWFGGLARSGLIFLGLNVRPGTRGVVGVKFGLTFYDLVTRKNRRTPTHFLTSRGAALAEVPGLAPGIVATATYWDAWITQAERLCIELIRDARLANPLCRALNYVRPTGVEGDRVVLRDEIGGASVAVRPGLVVNATGAWVDLANRALGLETRFMGGTKGSHLVVDCPALLKALGDRMVYYAHQDGRVCIAFPFLGKVIMGSTDIRTDDPDAARCTADEVEYMMATLAGVFPGIRISRGDVVYAFCGVRPLPAAEGAVLANVSRGHSVRVIEPEGERAFPIYCLIGGKWTTFRAFAEQVADRLLARLGAARQCSTEHVPIGGGRDFPADEGARQAWVARVAGASGLAEARVEVLLARYGTAAEAYALAADAAAEAPLAALPGYTAGEIGRIAAGESVEHLEDLICRRSTIALLGQAGPEALAELADVVGGVLGWDARRRTQEVERAAAAVAVS